MLSDAMLISSRKLKGAIILAEGGWLLCLFLHGIRASFMIKSACRGRRQQLELQIQKMSRPFHLQVLRKQASRELDSDSEDSGLTMCPDRLFY